MYRNSYLRENDEEILCEHHCWLSIAIRLQEVAVMETILAGTNPWFVSRLKPCVSRLDLNHNPAASIPYEKLSSICILIKQIELVIVKLQTKSKVIYDERKRKRCVLRISRDLEDRCFNNYYYYYKILLQKRSKYLFHFR